MLPFAPSIASLMGTLRFRRGVPVGEEERVEEEEGNGSTGNSSQREREHWVLCLDALTGS